MILYLETRNPSDLGILFCYFECFLQQGFTIPPVLPILSSSNHPSPHASPQPAGCAQDKHSCVIKDTVPSREAFLLTLFKRQIGVS